MKGVLSKGVFAALQRAGPYVLVELLLPGGTLLALLLWISSGVGRGHFAEAQPIGMTPSNIERVVR